jgi:hypothetical protein
VHIAHYLALKWFVVACAQVWQYYTARGNDSVWLKCLVRFTVSHPPIFLTNHSALCVRLAWHSSWTQHIKRSCFKEVWTLNIRGGWSSPCELIVKYTDGWLPTSWTHSIFWFYHGKPIQFSEHAC